VQGSEKRIRTNAFDKLILEHNQKELIKSLVANHEKKKKISKMVRGLVRMIGSTVKVAALSSSFTVRCLHPYS
jgi:hypothetical protein